VPDGARAAVPGRSIGPDDAIAIESSLEVAAECGGDLTARVYAVLFEREPHLRELFWRDEDGAIRGEMLMKVLEAILDFVGERRYAGHLVEAEAINHEGYEVPRAVFASFFGIVADVVRDACGQAWTDSMSTAWQRMLAELDVYVAGDTRTRR
jgi:hemoglobin-like flavoprotein